MSCAVYAAVSGNVDPGKVIRGGAAVFLFPYHRSDAVDLKDPPLQKISIGRLDKFRSRRCSDNKSTIACRDDVRRYFISDVAIRFFPNDIAVSIEFDDPDIRLTFGWGDIAVTGEGDTRDKVAVWKR